MTRETAVKAIEAWRANPATTFTPANILREFGDDILTALRDPAPAARTSRWRYEIQDEPEGEFKNAEFAQVFDDKGASVGTLKLHHAFLIVGSINNDELVKIETPPIPPILQREWMAQALFEVDAPDHLEWEDVGIDKRERYLCLADAAIRRNNTCP
ncbi:hypothetical protein AB0C41_32850 [Micromonospora taraxaci]|uniref:hypothetical protein n=1 Tax=Actinomycetes TaxID=1760 RepID=UPI0033C4DE7A